MKPGTIIRLPDGREGTVVFHGLVGYGIRWGRIEIDPAVFDGTVGDLGMIGVSGKDLPLDLEPEALLCSRAPKWAWALECVGEEYEVVEG
jgi:hypothetical protein